MLCLDIETTGLSTQTCHITVACTYDGTHQKAYHFMKPCLQADCTCPLPLKPPPERCPNCTKYHSENASKLLEALDMAPSICGYNCIQFDIPFLCHEFDVPIERSVEWVRKCIDPFPFLSDTLGVYCKLSQLLYLNGMDSKSASGKDAVDMAYAHQWEKLEEYCAKDAKLTWDLVKLPKIKIPIQTLTMGGTMEIEWDDQKSVWALVNIKPKTVKRTQNHKKLKEVPSLFD